VVQPPEEASGTRQGSCGGGLIVTVSELVDEIEKSGISIETLLRLIADWRIIEAREHLKLADGRLAIMEKLSEYIQKGAPEVQKIQPLFEEHGWLVDPS
jgi:hypothetical protein